MLLPNGIHRTLHFISYAVMGNLHCILFQFQQGVAGARIAIIRAANAAGVDETHALDGCGERLVRMTANTNVCGCGQGQLT